MILCSSSLIFRAKAAASPPPALDPPIAIRDLSIPILSIKMIISLNFICNIRIVKILHLHCHRSTQEL